MALACPKCGSENVQKISLVRSAGITHVTSQHNSSGVGVGVGPGGIGVGVGKSQGTSRGVQQSEISKKLDEEFASIPKPKLKGLPILLSDRARYIRLVLGLAGLGFSYWLYQEMGILTEIDHKGEYVVHRSWLFNFSVFIGFFLFGGFGLYYTFLAIGAEKDTGESREKLLRFEEENQDIVKRHKKQHLEMWDEGFYCHACGNKFIKA